MSASKNKASSEVAPVPYQKALSAAGKKKSVAAGKKKFDATVAKKIRKSPNDAQSSGQVEQEEREELMALQVRMKRALRASERKAQADVPSRKSPSRAGREKFSEQDAESYLKSLRKQQKFMPVGEHLEELRWRIIRSLFWFFLFSSIAFLFYNKIWDWIMSPILPLMDNADKMGIQLKMITTKLSDYVIMQFKVAFMVGFVFSIPAILVELWHFILPALGRVKKFWGNFLFLFSILLFSGGFFLARIYLWPLMTGFMIYDWAPPSMTLNHVVIKPEIHLILDDYLSFFFMFHLAFGLVFQLPVITLLLALLNVLSAKFYFSSWRYAIVILAVVSAVVTPPDVASMTAMMIPLVILYAISGGLIWLVEKFKRHIPAKTEN